MRKSLKDHLADFAHAEVVGECETAEGTLNEVRRSRPDVLILDLDLRGGNGLEVLKAVKSELPETLVVVFSGYANPRYRQRCLGLGADHFFRKTEDYELLVDLVSAFAESALRTPQTP